MLDLLEDYMELRSISYARLDGGTTRPRRNLDIKLVGVISYLTGGYLTLSIRSFNKRSLVSPSLILYHVYAEECFSI